MDQSKHIVRSATGVPQVSDPQRRLRQLKAKAIAARLAMPVKAASPDLRTTEDRRVRAQVQRAKSRMGLADERLISAEAQFRLMRW